MEGQTLLESRDGTSLPPTSEGQQCDPVSRAFTSIIERAIEAGAQTIAIGIEADPDADVISSVRFLDDGVGYTTDQLGSEVEQDPMPLWCAEALEVFRSVRILTRSGFELDAIGQLSTRPGATHSALVSSAGDVGAGALLPLAGLSGGTEVMLRRFAAAAKLDADAALVAVSAALTAVRVADLGGAVAVDIRVTDRAGRTGRRLTRSLTEDAVVATTPARGGSHHSDEGLPSTRDDETPRTERAAPFTPIELEPENERFLGDTALPGGVRLIASDEDDEVIPRGFRITDVSADPVQDYLKQIGKVPLLNAAEEVDLAMRIEAGLFAEERVSHMPAAEKSSQLGLDLQWVARDGQRAMNHLVSANLRLVVSLAKRYAGRRLHLLDLIQEGNLGLIRAVEKFDCTKGYKFSTYATWWIRQAITRALADQARTIRIPVHVVERMNKLHAARRSLEQQLGRDPSLDELASAVGERIEDVIQMLGYDLEPRSLSEMACVEMRGDGLVWGELGELIQDDGAIDAVEVTAAKMLHPQIESLLDSLSEREAGVIRMRFGLGDGQPTTLDQIGDMFGVTRERIRQIETKTMAKLQDPSRSQSLRDYLGD